MILKNVQAPLATLIAYEGANPNDYKYVNPVLIKIRNSGIDSWNEEKQLEILEKLNEKEIKYLIKMCNQIADESWDEFSSISGYKLDELNNLKLRLIEFLRK